MTNATSQMPRLTTIGTLDMRIPLAGTTGAGLVGGVIASAAGWGKSGVWAVIVAGAAAGILLLVREVVASDERQVREAALEFMGVGISTATERPKGELPHPQHVVALAGHSQAGKSSIARKLHELHPEWGWASCGAFVRAEAKRHGVRADPAVEHKFGDRLVHKLGGEEFLRRVLEEAAVAPGAETLVIDDIYHVEVYEALARRWPHLTFVALEVPQSLTSQLGPVKPAAVAESPLDEQARRLTIEYPPTVRLEGASSDAEANARSTEIAKLVAA